LLAARNQVTQVSVRRLNLRTHTHRHTHTYTHTYTHTDARTQMHTHTHTHTQVVGSHLFGLRCDPVGRQQVMHAIDQGITKA
jgi:hypothetical protein